MTPGAPSAVGDALRLVHARFLNRTDLVAIQAPWGKPFPVDANKTLDDLLLAHLLGEAAPAAKVTYSNRRGAGVMAGHYRVGSYSPATDGMTRWVCLDFDGAGHANALADPEATALLACDAFAASGLPSYLERSGGGTGWHVWCFFDPPLAAAKAQALGRELAPKEALLAGSTGFADARSARGLEVFPKQSKLSRRGFGNLVWLPWWHGAPAGANAFYRRAQDGTLEPYVPTELEVASPEAIERLLAKLPGAALGPPPAPGPGPRPAKAARQQPRLPRPRPTSDAAATGETGETGDSVWGAWRRKALAALPLEPIYATWLTGRAAGIGWLECRDPASPSGDQTPSAGVADGTGEAERGTFHSFIDERSLSVFDFLVAHGGVADFRAARAYVADLSGVQAPPAGVPLPPAGVGEPPSSPSVASSPSAPSTAKPKRKPRIIIRTEEHAVVDEAIAALARIDGVYCRGPLLVHVVKDDSPLANVVHPPGSLRIFTLGQAGIRDRLTLAADWFSVKEKRGEVEEVPAHPPAWVVPEVEARKIWRGVRYLSGVVESPVLRPDGSLLDRPGYDDATGLLFVPNTQFPPIPAQPTQQDAAAAAAELLDVVIDFPFNSDAHRAAWVAGVLTPLARYAFSGPAPLFLMDANVRSAGKTLLADLIGEIVSGRSMPRTPQAPDENEEIKRITAIALDGTRIVLIDNINRPLGSGAMDAVLTGTTWSERILGKSERVDLPLLAVWYATGNNITFKGDTARRCLHVRIDSDLEKPELREGFKHPKLQAWVQEQRPRLVMAALTILHAYCVAGRPAMGFKAWGSFGGWSDLVRSAVVWAGLPDPGDTRAELDEVDTDSSNLADLIAGWEELPNNWGLTGCTVARALQALQDDLTGRRYPRLRSALGELCQQSSGHPPTARKVGIALRRFRGRVIARRRLQTRVLDGNNLWFVQRVDAETPIGAEAPGSPPSQLSLIDNQATPRRVPDDTTE